MSRKILQRASLIEGLKAGQSTADGLLRKAVVTDSVDPVEGANRTLQFTISTASPDRDNDTVNANGWELGNFKRNPVVLWAHDYSQLPVAKATKVGVENGALKAEAEFATHPFAETVFQMLKGGFLRATSVGFMPRKYCMNEVRGGLDFEEQELLEFSIVPVPANPEALIEARAAGIDVAPLKNWAEGVIKGLKTVTPEERKAHADMVAALQAAAEALAKASVSEKKADETEAPAPVVCSSCECTLEVITPRRVVDGAVTCAACIVAEKALQKRGRVLSSANEGRIRRAKDILDEVLAQLAEAPTEEPPPADNGGKDAKDGLGTCGFVDGGDGTACTLMATELCSSCGAGMCGDHVHPTGTCYACATKAAAAAAAKAAAAADVLALDDDEVLVIEDPADDAVDRDELRAVLAGAVAASMKELEQVVRTETAAAINRARGRVD